MVEPGLYPSSLDTLVTLANRRHLHIRPLRPGEDRPIRDLDSRLSLQTRYRRFFSPMPVLAESIVRLLSSVDYIRRLVLIAEAVDANRSEGEIVAVCNYGAIDADSVEVGIVVQDGWQHQGVGTALLDKLLNAAEDRGFHRFVVHLLPENSVTRKLLRRFGRVVATKTSFGVSEVAFVRRHALPSDFGLLTSDC
jgi:acetyltransferase